MTDLLVLQLVLFMTDFLVLQLVLVYDRPVSVAASAGLWLTC